MPGAAFVTHAELNKHLQAEWQVAHNIWPMIKDYVPAYGYTKNAIDSMFEGYTGGGKAQVHANNVVGLPTGAIPYATATGLTGNTSNIFYDASAQCLGVRETSPTARVHINSIGGSVPALNLESGSEGELVTPDGQAIRIGHWNAGTTTFTERMKIDSAGVIFVSYLTSGSVAFAGAGGEIKQDNNYFFYDVSTHQLALGHKIPTNILHVSGVGTTSGWGGAYGGVVARFHCTESKHTSVVIDALSGYDPVLGFSENGAIVWAIRNDASATDKFQIRYHVGEANRTDFQIDNAGNVTIPTGIFNAGQVVFANSAIPDDGRGLSSIHTLSADPAKSDGIALYVEGHIGAITTDGPTYGAGTWLNIDSGATLGGDVRALDIGIYERGADCSGGNAYGLAIHMDFDLDNPPAAIYPFRLNCWSAGATPDALIFAPNKEALGLVIGAPGDPVDAYLKIKLQDGSVYRIPLVKE